MRTISEYIGNADHLAPLTQRQGFAYLELTLQGHELLNLSMLSDREALGAWETGKLGKLQASELLPQSQAAILAYMGHQHREINEALRGERPMTSEIKRHILGIRAALYDPRAHLTENVTLYRGGLIPLHRCKIGERFTQPSIVSFSVDVGLAREWHSQVTSNKKGFVKCVFELKARQNDKRYLSLSGMGGGEYEVITNGSEYEVIGIRREFSRIVVTIGKVGEAI